MESNQLLDPQQEGFRRYHSTTYAVTRLVQSIVNGFNKNNQTLACFVDLAKAFDSVWRPGLMYKLSKIGVSGRLWMWIKNFLHDRTVQCHIGDIIGDIFHTEMGLPQGSVEGVDRGYPIPSSLPLSPHFPPPSPPLPSPYQIFPSP